jgi:alpha-D-xyloside xylohydrolase
VFDAVEYDDMRENLLRRPDILLYVPRTVREIREDSAGITLLCEAKEYRKGTMPPLFLQDDLALLPTGKSISAAVRIEAFGEGVLRVRMLRASSAGGAGSAAAAEVPPRVKEMQVAAEAVPGLFSLRREDEEGNERSDGRYLILDTGLVQAGIDTADWNLTMGPSGRPVYRQYTRDEHAISHLVGQQDPSHGEAFDGFESYPFALGYDPASGREFWTDAVECAYDEHFYGFGEKFGPLDKLGQEVLLWHTDALSVSSARSYKNVPFFISSAGYGVYLNTSAKCRFLMGSYHYKAYQMICHEAEADIFFIYGPTIKEVLPRYTDITGKSPMLPEWSFGTWISKNTYRTQEELLSVARTVREKRIPCDVVHLDVGWFEREWMCDYEFSRERFPDPKGMTDELHRLGFRLSLWQLPYFKQENKLYPELKEKGYLARRPDGRVSSPEADGVLDFSNPDAVQWYKGKLKQLLDHGVSVIKTDFGESTEEEAVYHRYTGDEMHNLYPLLYNRVAFELTEEENGEGIVWARSAWAGSQRYPLHWGGDSASDFHGMYHSLRGGLSFGLSGFTFWSHDVGGYYGDTEPDVYVRWAQMGMFSSHMRMHGTSSREPWRFGEEAERIFLYYARLRYRLLPYIWGQARLCAEHSLPMLRALVIDFQDDPNTWNVDDQYLFGDSILVAPVFSRRPVRRVYLPAGELWYDVWTDERFDGGQWVEKDVPLDTLPLFVRGGSIVETGPVMHHTGERPLERTDLHYYPGAGSASAAVPTERRIRLYGGGDARLLEPAGKTGGKGFEVRVRAGQYPRCLVVHGTSAREVTAAGCDGPCEGGPGLVLKEENE